MAASSRQLASGRHLTACSIWVLPIKADGSLDTAGASETKLIERSSYTGFLESVEFESEVEVEDGTVLGSPQANDIPSVGRHTVTLVEPLRYTATNHNLLAASYYNTTANPDGTTGSPYVKIALTRASKTFTFYALMRSYRESYAKTKAAGTMTLSMIDTADNTTPNPAYS